MRDSTRLLLPFCLGLAMTARAELNYFLYDLSAGTAERLDAPPENVLAETYHTGNLMLFVQDTTVSEAYAVGVFEVTMGQAQTMGWRPSFDPSSDAPCAYATKSTGNDFTNSKPLPANLAWPTPEQWAAYAGEKWKPCNVRGGRGTSSSLNPVARYTWWNNYRKEWTANDHGVYNIYGNVAEYATDTLFYGGYALRECEYDDDLSLGVSASEIGVPSDNVGLLGARLVYNLPEEQRHAVTVTLDGEAVGEAAAYKPGEAVTVEPPTPGAWRALTGRVVTPEGLAVSGGVGEPIAFTMPGEAVTVAYTSTEYAEITVVNGTLTLAEGKDRAYVGDWVTVTADAPKAWQIFKGWEVTGMTTPPATTEIIIFSVPEDAQDAITFTATYQDLPRVLIHGGTAAVSDGEARGNGFYTAGATLTLTPNTPEGWRFQGWQKDEGFLEGNVFTVPESGVTTLTARFTEPPRVFVSGGTATVSKGEGYGNNAYAPGTVLRLTHADRVGYTFAGWKGGTVSDNTFTVPESGVTTLTATYTARTRVLVAGGTAKPASTDGYYVAGATLTLTPDKPVGYVFDHWEGGTVSGSTFTVPASGTVTLTAVFKVDETADGSGATLHLGSNTDHKPYDTLFGSTPAKSATTVTDPYGNNYLSYAYTDAAAVAVFDLEKGEVSFDSTVSTSTDGKTKCLQLRRVNASDGNDFYMGVFETTYGHIAYLAELIDGEQRYFNEADKSNAKAYLNEQNGNKPSFEDCRAMLKEAFPDIPSFRFPTPTDVIKIGDSVRSKNKRAGYGYGESNDPDVTADMIVYAPSQPQATGSKSRDPYGFYDLWGNNWEYASDGNPFGGSGWEPLGACHTEQRFAAQATAVAFRPVIDVETPVALKVEGATGTIWAVEGEKLFPSPDETPVRPGYEFVGWTLGGAKINPETYVVKRADAGKTLAPQWEAISLTAKFVDCEGPAKVVPGLKTRVLTDPNRTLSTPGFKIVPSGAATYSPGAGFAIITFADDAKGEVTVTALYNKVSLTAEFKDCEGPAAVAPGETVAVSPTAGGTLVGLNVAPGTAADWALDGDGASLTFAGNAKGKVTVTGLYAGETLDVAYKGCSGPTLACPGLTATLYLEPGRELERVEVVPAGAATYSREAGTLTFAQGASGSVTVTAVYAQPAKPGFRLLLR